MAHSILWLMQRYWRLRKLLMSVLKLLKETIQVETEFSQFGSFLMLYNMILYGHVTPCECVVHHTMFCSSYCVRLEYKVACVRSRNMIKSMVNANDTEGTSGSTWQFNQSHCCQNSQQNSERHTDGHCHSYR